MVNICVKTPSYIFKFVQLNISKLHLHLTNGALKGKPSSSESLLSPLPDASPFGSHLSLGFSFLNSKMRDWTGYLSYMPCVYQNSSLKYFCKLKKKTFLKGSSQKKNKWFQRHVKKKQKESILNLDFIYIHINIFKN